MRRLVLITATAGALLLGSASSAFAGASNPPGCFGHDFIAPLATSSHAAVASFVQGAVNTDNPPAVSVGRTGIPFLKEGCPTPSP